MLVAKRALALLTAAGLLLAAGAGNCGAAAADEGPLFGATPPRFAADYTTALDSAGAATLTVAVQVPYSECQFVRVPAGYGAALEFLVVIRDGGRQVAGDVWQQRFVVGTFEESKDGGARLAVSRTFRVPPGKYKLKVQVRDDNGGLASEAERGLTVAGLGKESLGLTDLVFGECLPDSGGGPGRFARNASRRYADGLGRLCVRTAIVDLRPPADRAEYRIAYRVRDEDGSEVNRGDTLVAGRPGREVLLRPPVRGLFLGLYTLEVTVEEGGRRWRSEGAFEVESVTVPVGRQWTVLLEILEYIGSAAELERLREARSEEARESAWKEFWARRDPTPDTPRNEALLEFMRRVRFANTQFSGLGPGWRSDQGRVYIRYGPPDQIEDFPATQTSSPVQVWHYLSPSRRFVFADRHGFGRYELVSED